jgi:hypothetical protein
MTHQRVPRDLISFACRIMPYHQSMSSRGEGQSGTSLISFAGPSTVQNKYFLYPFNTLVDHVSRCTTIFGADGMLIQTSLGSRRRNLFSSFKNALRNGQESLDELAQWLDGAGVILHNRPIS